MRPIRPSSASALFVLIASMAGGAACARATPPDPRAVVEQLLSVDREFSRRSAGTDLVSGLSAMLADDVVVPAPGGLFIEGKPAAVDALRADARSVGARISWTPVRGGISADGQHGFTLGYMTLEPAGDAEDVPLKYLAYWIRKPEGWRVVVYKRALRPPGDVSLATIAPAVPSGIVPPNADAAAVARALASLDKVERDFSNEAQRIGLPAAFAKFGSADAMFIGRAPAFTVGAEAIGRSMEADAVPGPSPVSWAPDRSLMASSGDLGVTIGIIRGNAPEPDGSVAAFSYFTIWRRASTAEPWLYIAE